MNIREYIKEERVQEDIQRGPTEGLAGRMAGSCFKNASGESGYFLYFKSNRAF